MYQIVYDFILTIYGTNNYEHLPFIKALIILYLDPLLFLPFSLSRNMKMPAFSQHHCTCPHPSTTALKGCLNNQLLLLTKLDSSHRFLRKTTFFPKDNNTVFRCFLKNHPVMAFCSKTTETKHSASVFSPKASMSPIASDMQMQAPRRGTEGKRACQGVSLGTLIFSTKRKGDSDNV